MHHKGCQWSNTGGHPKLKKALFVDQPYDVKMRSIQNQSNQNSGKFKVYIFDNTIEPKLA